MKLLPEVGLECWMWLEGGVGGGVGRGEGQMRGQGGSGLTDCLAGLADRQAGWLWLGCE